MTSILVYDDTAKQLNILADIKDTTVAEVVDEILDEYSKEED